MSDPAYVEDVIRSAFVDGPGIDDHHLCTVDLDQPSSATEGLDIFRGKGRYELLDQVEWIDFGVLYRLSPHAVWHFAPTFMLLALRNLHRYEFYELMQPFRFPEHLLEDVGVDPHASFEELDSQLSALGIRRQIENAGLDDSPRPADHALGLRWFAWQAHLYTAAERSAVADFLDWLSREWPHAPGVVLARKHFWLGS